VRWGKHLGGVLRIQQQHLADHGIRREVIHLPPLTAFTVSARCLQFHPELVPIPLSTVPCMHRGCPAHASPGSLHHPGCALRTRPVWCCSRV
jgi:hypothetical protein